MEEHHKEVSHGHHEHHKSGEHHEPVKVIKRSKKGNYWKFLSLILLALLVFSVFTDYNLSTNNSNLSGEAAASKAVTLINENILQGQAVAELKSVTEEDGLYKLELTVSGQEALGYITKDGKLFFPQVIELSESSLQTQQQQTPPQEVVKSDKPEVDLFIMSHCPYGTQMEKGMLPVAYLLGDKIDFNVKFVSYAMHGETEVKEQLNQYCIAEEQEEKLLDYLQCFLEDGDGEGCLVETGVDLEMLTSCTETADQEFGILASLADQSSWLSGKYPLFNTHKEDNVKYGVQGSPTLVINGETVSSGRDSVSLLGAVCDAFNVAPEECDVQLEASAPSPGFGWSGSGSDNIASCGG